MEDEGGGDVGSGGDCLAGVVAQPESCEISWQQRGSCIL